MDANYQYNSELWADFSTSIKATTVEGAGIPTTMPLFGTEIRRSKDDE